MPRAPRNRSRPVARANAHGGLTWHGAALSDVKRASIMLDWIRYGRTSPAGDRSKTLKEIAADNKCHANTVLKLSQQYRVSGHAARLPTGGHANSPPYLQYPELLYLRALNKVR
jgi:hypothetical protein